MLRIWTPLALLLVGCPTPPESSVGGGAGSNLAPAGGGEGGGVAAPMPSSVDESSGKGAFVITELPEELKNRPADGDQPTSEEAQAKVRAGDHITMKGRIICSDCKGQLVVNIAPFVEPTEGEPAGPQGESGSATGMQFAPVVVKASGPFEIAVPRYSGKVVLEVIDDVDGNGLPSPGERLAVVHRMGKLTADKDHKGIKVRFGSDGPGAMPGGGPGGPPPTGDGAPPPPGDAPQ